MALTSSPESGIAQVRLLRADAQNVMENGPEAVIGQRMAAANGLTGGVDALLVGFGNLDQLFHGRFVIAVLFRIAGDWWLDRSLRRDMRIIMRMQVIPVSAMQNKMPRRHSLFMVEALLFGGISCLLLARSASLWLIRINHRDT